VSVLEVGHCIVSYNTCNIELSIPAVYGSHEQ